MLALHRRRQSPWGAGLLGAAVSVALVASAGGISTATAVGAAPLHRVPVTVAGLTATPLERSSTGAYYGGPLQVTARVGGAATCSFSGSANLVGLPVSIPCASGSVTLVVTAPYNVTAIPQTFSVRLRVTGVTSGGATQATNGSIQPTPLLAGASAVAANAESRCVIATGGSVRCWGSSTMGQLGIGTISGPDQCSSASLPPIPCSVLARSVVGVGGSGLLTGATAIAATGEGYCVALRAGGVDCWGANDDGQLGTGATTGPQSCGGIPCSMVPVSVTGLSATPGAATGAATGAAVTSAATRVVALTGLGAGGGMCAVTASGGVLCWGANGLGQAGDASNVEANCVTGACVPSPQPVVTRWRGLVPQATLTPLGQVALVASAPSGESYCAVLRWGGIDCWGDGSRGALGSSRTEARSSATPVTGTLGAGLLLGVTAAAGSASPIVGSVGAGYCAIQILGRVACWGSDTVGQLGAGSGDSNLTCGPTSAPCSAVPVIVVAGQTGHGVMTRASGVTGGIGGYCAALVDGRAACWGRNFAGSLGYGSLAGPEHCGLRPCSPRPVVVREALGAAPLTGNGPLHGVQSIVTDGSTYCALRFGARAACWGAGTLGQTGIFAATPRNAPQPVQVQGIGGRTALNNIASLSASSGSVCALLLSRAVNCWGSGGSGQLGIGTAAQRSVAEPVRSFG